MNGVDMTIGGELASSPFGKRHDYEGTYDSTIFLWDCQFNPEAGVPANGALLENLCADRLATLSGLTGDDLKIVVQNGTGTFLGTERTSVGGLHAASTQAGDQDASASFSLSPRAAAITWLANNTDAGADYAVMISAWVRKTRDVVVNAAPQALSWFANGGAPTANYHSNGENWRPKAGRRLDTNVVGTDGPGCQSAAALNVPGVFAVASQGWEGSKSGVAMVLANIGAAGAWASTNFNKAPSGVIYRVQVDLINLKETGGTVAERAAALLVEQNNMLARAFATGRLSGETNTAAAILKP